MGVRSWGRRVVSAGVASGLVGMSVIGVAAPAQATVPDVVRSASFGDGFKVETRTTYRLDPAAGVVHVAFDATLTNQRSSSVSGGYVTQYYLPDYGVPVVAEAVSLKATEGGSTLPVRRDGTDSPHLEIAVIDLQPDLMYGNTQQVHFTYDLPKVAARSEGFTRLNDAYATFPVLAIGDPGLTSVEIRVPEAFEVELVGDTMERRRARRPPGVHRRRDRRPGCVVRAGVGA